MANGSKLTNWLKKRRCPFATHGSSNALGADNATNVCCNVLTNSDDILFIKDGFSTLICFFPSTKHQHTRRMLRTILLLAITLGFFIVVPATPVASCNKCTPQCTTCAAGKGPSCSQVSCAAGVCATTLQSCSLDTCTTTHPCRGQTPVTCAAGKGPTNPPVSCVNGLCEYSVTPCSQCTSAEGCPAAPPACIACPGHLACAHSVCTNGVCSVASPTCPS